jgi:hypothetical protein
LDNVVNNTNPMLHQQDSTSTSTEGAFELKVPGGGEPARLAGAQTWSPVAAVKLAFLCMPGAVQVCAWQGRRVTVLCCRAVLPPRKTSLRL